MRELYKADDEKLLLLISTGDRVAFSYLYNLYGNNLLRFVSSLCFSREISEEIVQDLFLKIWLHRENLVNVTAIKPYLYQSAKNLLLNRIRALQKEARVYDVVKADALQATNNGEHQILYNEYYTLAQTAINQLPLKRKLIFKLHHYDALSLDEISERLAISKSVVKKQLYSGIHFVRNFLDKQGVMFLLTALWLYLK